MIPILCHCTVIVLILVLTVMLCPVMYPTVAKSHLYALTCTCRYLWFSHPVFLSLRQTHKHTHIHTVQHLWCSGYVTWVQPAKWAGSVLAGIGSMMKYQVHSYHLCGSIYHLCWVPPYYPCKSTWSVTWQCFTQSCGTRLQLHLWESVARRASI